MIVKTTNHKEIIQEGLDLSFELAIKSAKLLKKYQKKISTLTITNKQAQGVASNADIESEKMIIAGIKKKFPTHYILAEESAFKDFNGQKNRFDFLKEKEWVWIIDPLDGTNNYLNGLDYYGICISLVRYGVPQTGLVLRAETGECFYALKDGGAYCFNYSDNFKSHSRRKKIVNHKSQKKLKDSLLVTGFATEKGEPFEQEFEMFKYMMGRSRGIRRMGSAALDLCYVATGLFDCFWEKGLCAWDVAASGLICQEAGLKVSDYDGQAFHPFRESIIAARTSIHKEMLSLFRNRL